MHDYIINSSTIREFCHGDNNFGKGFCTSTCSYISQHSCFGEKFADVLNRWSQEVIVNFKPSALMFKKCLQSCWTHRIVCQLVQCLATRLNITQLKIIAALIYFVTLLASVFTQKNTPEQQWYLYKILVTQGTVNRAAVIGN